MIGISVDNGGEVGTIFLPSLTIEPKLIELHTPERNPTGQDAENYNTSPALSTTVRDHLLSMQTIV